MIFTDARGDTLVAKRVELPAVTMTYADLSQLIEDVKSLAQKANSNIPGINQLASLTVSSDTDSVTITGQSKLANLSNPPPVGLSVRFSYDTTLIQAPISEITIILTDSNRAIDVKGLDQTQVNAIASYVAQRLHAHTTNLAGPSFRFITMALLMTIGIILINVIGPKPAYTYMVQGLGFLLSVLGLVALILRWFPGTAIYSTSASFIDRNINVISFIGVLITILAPIVTLVVRTAQRGTVPKNSS